MDWKARAPFLVGTLGIALLGAYLTVEDGGPSPLSRPHAQLHELERLWGCDRCHAPAGLTAGCLGCHSEIAGQLAARSGYHGALVAVGESDCRPCHFEHLGPDFSLVARRSWGPQGPEGFRHQHVAYRLTGKHASLPCGGCHASQKTPPLALPGFASVPRRETFLGLRQECAACHDDPHAGGLSPACETCHSQEAFRPASGFRHDDRFVLEGAHATAPCARCHLIPEARPAAEPLAFKSVRGTRCAECHASPHRGRWKEDCEGCHQAADARWELAASRLTPDQHAETGFRLEPPHTQVACGSCHASGAAFAVRYPDPHAEGYRRGQQQCAGCHRDVHAGQFGARGERCRDCHAPAAFLPVTIAATSHPILALRGAHLAVSCRGCHRPEGPGGVRRFAGTARTCKACHADPHGGQFAAELTTGDCDACHGDAAATFRIEPFDHLGRTGHALTGAHAAAPCGACHTPGALDATAGAPAAHRVYRGTPSSCGCCHADPHVGQFQVAGKTACERCHPSTVTWKENRFDHTRDARFALDGVHARVACDACHPTVRAAAGGSFVQFKPLGTRCQDCHALEED